MKIFLSGCWSAGVGVAVALWLKYLLVSFHLGEIIHHIIIYQSTGWLPVHYSTALTVYYVYIQHFYKDEPASVSTGKF